MRTRGADGVFFAKKHLMVLQPVKIMGWTQTRGCGFMRNAQTMCIAIWNGQEEGGCGGHAMLTVSAGVLLQWVCYD